MPTKYPWQRADPSTSTPTSSSSRATPSGQSSSSGPSILLNHSSGTSTNGNGNCSDKDRAVVVSASGRAAFSPNANTGSSNGGLGVEGSPQLRIRNSPRTGAGAGAGAGGAFGSMRDSYPSPSSNALRTPVRNGVHGADSSNTGGSSGGAGAGAGVGSRVRTIFGRRRKNSDTINMDGLDVSISSSPAGTPIHDRLAAAAAGAGAGAGGRGGWRQVPVDSPGSSTAGSPAPRSNAQAQAQSGRGGKGGVPVKRFDARGYPTRDELHADSKIDSPTKVAMLGHGRRRSAESTDSEGGSDVAAIGANAYGPGANTGAGAGGVGSTGSRKMGSGEGQTAAARYAFSSRQSYLNSTANGNGKATSFSSSSGPGAGVEKAKSTSLYPPTLTNYSLSSPSYSPSDPHGPSTSSSTVNGGERRSGGRADYFAATASILGGYENVRTPSDDQGLSGSHATGAAGRTGGSGGGAGGSSGRSSKGRYPSASPSSSLYASHTGPAPGYESFEPTHYDGYGYAKSITGTMRTHRTQGSEGTMGTMGSRAYLGRYDALQDQFVKDHGEGEGYEYGVGGIKGQGWSVGSRGGNKHLGHMFSLPPDPSTWSYLGPEADDEFHDPDVKPRGRTGFLGAMFTLRGAGNVGCLAVLVVVLVGMFAVYPITSQFLNKVQPTYGAYNLGGINATGQIPDIGPFQLIDHDTPTSAYTHTSFETGETWDLVFSDEFNRDGRTFWPGDDPFWEAQDLHYWQTNNKEWYHPTMVTTVGGSLRITLTNEKMNGLNYTGGMINSWNRFCFTGGYVEASVSLPGKNNVYGLWPAIWTLGNLGRAGFGGTLDGVWPYSYDTCDRGTLHNQTLNGQPVLPSGAGDKNNLDHLSYLPGQRLSRCTCPDDPTHPGPKHPDGTWVGRAAPEIDMFEAVIDSDTMLGEVSQSAQWAPFDPYYQFDNATANFDIYNASMTYINPWLGSVWQQATTALSYTDPNCYTGETGCYSRYGFEYASGNDGYITWLSDNRKAWTVRGAAMGANAVSMVGDRPIPQEPMYLLLNLGLSENFGPVDYEGLEPLFPVHMDVDYIRVYQDPSKHNIGCDPVEFPTQSYINRFIDVYNNPNITVMGQIENFTIPRNSLIDTC